MLPSDSNEALVATSDGRILHASVPLLDVLGYSAEEASRMTVTFLDATLTRSRWQHLVSTMRSQPGEDVAFESSLQAKSGVLQQRRLTVTHRVDGDQEYVVCSIGPSVIGLPARPVLRPRGASSSRSSAPARFESVAAAGGDAPIPADPRLRALVDTMEHAVVMTDARGLIIAANAAAESLFAVRSGDLAGRLCTDPRLRLVDTDGDPLALSAHPIMAALVTERAVRDSPIAMLLTDGTTRRLLMNAAPVRDGRGPLTGAVASLRDAPQRTRVAVGSAPAALLREIVEVCLSARTENELEKRVCATLAEMGDFAVVWRGVLKAKDQRVHVSCSAGNAREYLRMVRFRYDESDLGAGPVGEAVRKGRPQFVADIRQNERCAPWLEQSVKAGLLSMAVFPLSRNGSAHGVLTLHAREAHRFDDMDEAILSDIAGIVSLALEELRARDAEHGLMKEHAMQVRIVDALTGTTPVAHALFSPESPHSCTAAGNGMRLLFDEPFRSRGIVGEALPDFAYACYCRDLADAVAACAAGEGPVSRRDDVLRDWEGRESRWNWMAQTLNPGDAASPVLFTGWPLDVATPEDAQA